MRSEDVTTGRRRKRVGTITRISNATNKLKWHLNIIWIICPLHSNSLLKNIRQIKRISSTAHIIEWPTCKQIQLHGGCLIRSRNSVPFASTWVHPCIWWGPCCSLFLFFVFPILCLYALSSVLWCPLRFHYKHDVRFASTSSCLHYIRYLCLLAHSGVQHILRCVFSLVLHTLYCQLLWIFHFWLPLLYSLTFIC
jgi:hypothetical protein